MLDSAKIVAFVPSTDSKKARSFYEGLLGLRFVSDDQFALVLESNGTKIRVAKLSEHTPAPFTVLGWEVSDIENSISELQARGVSFERFGFMEPAGPPIWTAPTGDKVAWFKDPDGNILSLSRHVK
jgi:catechol 2,3-dioxygenase-like lactoylglutathione lyase family enzyme